MNIVVIKGTHPIIKGTSQKYILTINKNISTCQKLIQNFYHLYIKLSFLIIHKS